MVEQREGFLEIKSTPGAQSTTKRSMAAKIVEMTAKDLEYSINLIFRVFHLFDKAVARFKRINSKC